MRRRTNPVNAGKYLDRARWLIRSGYICGGGGALLGQWHRAKLHVGLLTPLLGIRLRIEICLCSVLGVMCRRRAASRARSRRDCAWLVTADMRPSSLGANFLMSLSICFSDGCRAFDLTTRTLQLLAARMRHSPRGGVFGVDNAPMSFCMIPVMPRFRVDSG